MVTLAGRGRDGSSRVSTNRLSPKTRTSNRSPGLVGRVTRFLLSAITVTAGLSHTAEARGKVILRNPKFKMDQPWPPKVQYHPAGSAIENLADNHILVRVVKNYFRSSGLA